MKPDKAAATRKIEKTVAAIARGKQLFSSDSAMQDFNRGCDHIHGLLRDSHTLFLANSPGSSAFLAITAIEEIAKLEVAMFRSHRQTPPSKRKNDLLFNHKAKHSIALQEVICIGTRLPQAIGEKRLRELLDMAETGKLVELRESALYTDNVNGRFVCPADLISRQLARELLLLALEVWDDRLVGLTDHTYEIDTELLPTFQSISAST